jgi:hypothetical protein
LYYVYDVQLSLTASLMHHYMHMYFRIYTSQCVLQMRVHVHVLFVIPCTIVLSMDSFYYHSTFHELREIRMRYTSVIYLDIYKFLH